MNLKTGIPVLLFLFSLGPSPNEGTADLADMALTGLRDVKYRHFLEAPRPITYRSSRTKRSAIFSTGVKVCPQETAKAIITSHRAYYKLRVCQEAIWEAFRIFFDRVPNTEEYMAWVFACQHENLCMDDLARNFSSSQEHLDMVATRVAELGESEGVATPEPGKDCPFTSLYKEMPTEPHEITDEPNVIPEKLQQYIVEFSVTLVDPIYSELLKDPLAPQYEDVIRELRDEMYHVFENIPGFKEIRVLGFRAEDVSVRYAVLFNGDTELSDQPEGYHTTNVETQGEMTAPKLKNIIVQALKHELSLPLDLNTLSFNDVYEVDEYKNKIAYTATPLIEERSAATVAAVEYKAETQTVRAFTPEVKTDLIWIESVQTPAQPAEEAVTQVEHTSFTEEEKDVLPAEFETEPEAVVPVVSADTPTQATLPPAQEVTVQQPLDTTVETFAPADEDQGPDQSNEHSVSPTEEGSLTGTVPESSRTEVDSGLSSESNLTEGDSGVSSESSLTEGDNVVSSESSLTEGDGGLYSEIGLTEGDSVVSSEIGLTEEDSVVSSEIGLTEEDAGVPSESSLAEGDSELSSESSLAEGDSELSSESSLAEGDSELSSESSLAEGDSELSSESSLTEGDIVVSSESSLMEGDIVVSSESSLTEGDSELSSESSLTEGDSVVFSESSLTEGDSVVSSEGSLTEGDSVVSSEIGLTEGDSVVSSEIGLTEEDGGVSSESSLTEGDSVVSSESSLTEGDSVVSSEIGLTEGDSVVSSEIGLTEEDGGVSSDSSLTEGDSVVSSEIGLTEGDSVVSSEIGLTEEDGGVSSDSSLTEGDSVVSSEIGLTEGDSVVSSDSSLTEGDSVVSSESSLTEGGGVVSSESSLTEGDGVVSSESSLMEGDSVVSSESSLTEGGGVVSSESSLMEGDSVVSSESSLTEGGGVVSFESSLTEGDGAVSSESSLTEGGGVVSSESSLTEADSGVSSESSLTEADSGVSSESSLTEADSGVSSESSLTEADSGVSSESSLTEADSGVSSESSLTEGDSGSGLSSDRSLMDGGSGSGLSPEADRGTYEVTPVPAMRQASTPVMAALDKSRDLVVLFSLRVTNMMFTDSLINRDSPEYKSLENTFLELLLPYLETNLTGFKALEILNFQNGSVIVNSRMKLNKAVPYNVTEAVHCVLEEFCNSAANQLEIQVDSRSLEVEQADEPDPCRSMTCSEFSRCVVNGWTGEAECMCDPGYSAVDGHPCQSLCTLEPDFCLNGGLCQNIPGHGATCRCPVGKYWHYHGERCDELVTLPMDTSFILTGLVGSVCLVAAVIGILIFINKKCIRPQKAVTVVHTLTPYAFDNTCLDNPVFQNDDDEFMTQVSTLPYPPSSVSSQSQASEHEHFASIENIHLSIEIPRELYTTRSEKLVSDIADFHHCIPHSQTWRASNQTRQCCLLRASESDCLEVTVV